MKTWMIVDGEKNVMEFDPVVCKNDTLITILHNNVAKAKRHRFIYEMDKTIHEILKKNKKIKEVKDDVDSKTSN